MKNRETWYPSPGPYDCSGCPGSRKAPHKILFLTCPQAEASPRPPLELWKFTPCLWARQGPRVPSNTILSGPGEISQCPIL